jgi:hypothetical protein
MGKIAAFIAGAIVATAPLAIYVHSHGKAQPAPTLDQVIVAMQVKHATAKKSLASTYQHLEASPEPAKPSGLEIYAGKIGLPFSTSDERPDEAIMSAMLLGDISADNVYVETRERSTSAGIESTTLYTADILLQKRIYHSRPNAELIYSVECSYGGGDISSRILYRNLGEDIDKAVLSAATEEATINPTIVNHFCAELKNSDAVAGLTSATATNGAAEAVQSDT